MAGTLTETEIFLLNPDQIRTDGGTQCRAALDEATLIEYKEAWKRGKKLPPVKIKYDGENYWLYDGFHTLKSFKEALKEVTLPIAKIEAEVSQGTQRDAIRLSLRANSEHGLKRTRADARRAIIRCLSDEEWSQWSNVEIARACDLDESMVRAVKLEISSENPKISDQMLAKKNGVEIEELWDARTRTQSLSNTRKVNRGGKVYPMNVSNTGKGGGGKKEESESPIKSGDKVLVISGRLKGTETTVLSVSNAKRGIHTQQGASFSLDQVEKIPDNQPEETTAIREPQSAEEALAACQFKEGDRVEDKINGSRGTVLERVVKKTGSPKNPAFNIHLRVQMVDGTIADENELFFQPISDEEWNKDQWRTPNTQEQPILDLVAFSLGGWIGLDPTSDLKKSVPAHNHFTIQDDCLKQSWVGLGSVFMNPPFSNPAPFLAKLVEQFMENLAEQEKAEAITLLKVGCICNQKTGQLIQGYASAVCFWRSPRIGFINGDDEQIKGPDFDCILVYFGENWTRFKRHFSPYGTVTPLASAGLEDKLKLAETERDNYDRESLRLTEKNGDLNNEIAHLKEEINALKKEAVAL